MTDSSLENEEILVVVSKLKKYIKETAGMNTAANVAAVLSKILKERCEDAIVKAKEAGRKTVMDRDFDAVANM